MYVCMYECMYVCMYICMYVCACEFVFVCVYVGIAYFVITKNNIKKHARLHVSIMKICVYRFRTFICNK